TSLIINGDKLLDFHLISQSVNIEETSVFSSKEQDIVSSLYMGEIILNQMDISSLPGFLGEADPIRFLQLTPGVQSGTEGGVGFYVRGGNVDQNLVLFNNAPVYNPGHLMGFFSVFHPDVINDVNLLKSGIPARYGERLSSLVQVNSIKGESDSLELKAEIGIISSRFMVNRSFNKGKGSFYVAGRRTYFDVLIKPLMKPILEDASPFFRNSDYYFYDYNAGVNYRIGTKDHLSLSFFRGMDYYNFHRDEISLENNLDWGNTVGSFRWFHSFNESLSWSNFISITHYQFGLMGSQSLYAFEMNSMAKNIRYKSMMTLVKENKKVFAGFEFTKHNFLPNEIDAEAGNFIIDFLSFNPLHAYEAAVFSDYEYSFGNFSFSAGIRYSLFNQIGPYKEYIKNEYNNTSDSIVFSEGESMILYHEPEPRLSLKYTLNNESSLKASYMRMAQYIHLATSSSVSLPTDIWLPSSKDILPQTGSQFSLGYYRNFCQNNYESSLEVYYKHSNNQLEFVRGVITNSVNMTLEDNIAKGMGRSYGAELYLRKKNGAVTGWISYALARTEKVFEEINEGKLYPAKHDRRHDFSLALMRELNDKWSASMVFIFVSGNALTIPESRYIIQGNILNDYGEVNSFRMPAYNRMDVSFTREDIKPNGNIAAWNFSVYNLYNRANPFYIYFETTGDINNYSLEVSPQLVSLFPVIPSISWSYKF
ncbi:MAG: TonB-dependent receptor plug domain-containing protein, partial [Bacteroidales bacterium]|nr:TonB-dependent receptor plug domain-containing protein [Bacteroidales bacterium]